MKFVTSRYISLLFQLFLLCIPRKRFKHDFVSPHHFTKIKLNQVRVTKSINFTLTLTFPSFIINVFHSYYHNKNNMLRSDGPTKHEILEAFERI